MTVTEAINTRYSTRNYVPNAKVEREKMDLILDAGRLAPNGLALEAWKFYLVEGDMSKMQEISFGQPHMGNASFAIALINYKHEFVKANPEVITKKLANSGLRQDQIDMYMINLDNKGTQYYREQLMFAATQMCLQATELEIGSVVVGGFDPLKAAQVLDIDTEKYEVGLLISFGVNADEKPKKRIRRDREDVVEYINI